MVIPFFAQFSNFENRPMFCSVLTLHHVILEFTMYIKKFKLLRIVVIDSVFLSFRNRDLNSLVDDQLYSDTDFKFVLPGLQMQSTALGLLQDKNKTDQNLFRCYVESVQRLAVAARQAGRHQVIFCTHQK